MKAFLLGLLAIFWSTLAMGGTLYTFNGGGTTGNWTDATIWTTDPTGSTSINSRVPANGDAVVITNSFVVTVSSAISTTALDLTIQRGGVLDLQSAAATFPTLASLSGQGTLRIAAPYFPGVTTNNFKDANTGTVEYYNWPAGVSALPTAVTQYNNLRFLNTGGTGTAYTVQVANNLTLNGSLTLTRTNTSAFPAGSSYASAAAAAAGAGLSFKIGNSTTARTLNIYGAITVGNGTFLGVNSANAVHILNAYGDFVNNGTVNLRNGADAQVAQLFFRGAADTNFACSGDTDLDIMTVDKGVDSQVLLNVTSTVNIRGGIQGNLRLNHIGDGQLLTLTNGVSKFGNNIYLPKIHIGTVANNGVAGTGYYELGTPTTSPTMWVAGGTILNNTALAFIIYGRLRVSAGLFESITQYSTVLREDAQVLIEGGTANVQKFRPASTYVNPPRGSFIITGGLFDCTGSSTATAAAEGFSRFAIPYQTQSFRMTGGTIRVENPESGDGAFHIGVDPNNAVVTGGTVEIYLPNSAIDSKILTTAPLWNLTIKKITAAGNNKALLSAITAPAGSTTTIQPLTVLNNFTIDPTNPVTFDASSQNLTIQGSFNIGTGCTYLPNPSGTTPTQTTTFNGGQDQLLTVNGTIGATAGLGTFYNWTVDKTAGTLTLAGSVSNYYTPSGTTLSILRGVLNDAGKTINVQGSLYNSAFHQSVGSGSITMNGTSAQTIGGDGTGIFGNLRINVPTASIAAGSVAVSLAANTTVSNILTLNSVHILSIGSYRLSLTNISPNAIGPVGAFTNQRMVQTAGNASDLGLQKTYGPGTAQSFVFPVGTGTKFTPATVAINVFGAVDKFGQVSVSPANMRNPFATGTNNALKYFWKVRSINFGALPSTSIDMSFQMVNADAVGTIGNYVGGRYLPTAWNTGFSSGITDLGTGSSRIDFSSMERFDGEFTAGDNTTPTVAFGAVTAFYSRTSGNWTTNTTWSTTSNTGPAVAAGSTAGVNFPGSGNPVFIGSASAGIFHTVTVIANAAKAGSLVIDRGSVLDIGTTGGTTLATAHNFGELPDSKVGGSGRLRISSTVSPAIFPGGDFGTFIQYGGGTVEYYSTGTAFTLPTVSGSLTLNQYRNLWLNAGNSTITLPTQDLRIYAQLKSGSSGGTGIVQMSSGATGNLRVDSLLAVQAGTFRYPNTVARALTIDTDVRVDVNATFDVSTTGTVVANTMTVGGSVTNNGLLDFKVGTSPFRNAGLTFTGTQNTSLTGTTAGATTDLSTLTVNKGNSRTPVLTVDVAGTLTTPINNWLTLTNGTFRYAKPSSTLTIHDGVATPYLITDNAGLTVDATSATVTVATNNDVAADLKLAGEIQVLQGTLNVGASGNVGNDLEYASAGAPTLRVTGGNLYVNGQVRRTVANLDGSLRYVQSGGTVNIDGRGATAVQSNERGLFEVQGPGSIFRMTAGTLNLHRSNQKSPITTADLYLAPDSTVVTAGTVRLGNTAAGVGNVTISVDSRVPLYDLIVENGANTTNTNTGLQAGTGALNLKGSLYIGTASNAFAFFNANNLPLNIDQNLYNYNPSTSTLLNAGGFQPTATTQVTTFTGKGPALQQLVSVAGNLTVFGGLTVNNAQASGTLQLGGNARTAGTLTLTKGTLDDNGNTITAIGDVLNSAVHSSTGTGSLTLGGTANQNIGGNGLGKFGNLTLNNSAGATTTASQEITKVLALNTGVLLIGSNLLNLSNTAAGAVTTTATFDNNHCIRTNGIVADLGVRKSYPAGASNFTFPIGAAVVTKYTPVQMNVTTSSTAGTITVQPIDIPHPSTTDNTGIKDLSYYWKVSSTGLASPVVTQVFTYVAADVNGIEANYKLGRFLNGQWYPTPGTGIATSVVNTTSHTLTNNGATYIDGDYTGGEPSEFGTVPTFYSRNSTAGLSGGAIWTNASAWTNNSDGSDPLPTFNAVPTLANPVVIRTGHLINSGSAGRGAASLLLNGTLDLGTNLSNNFSTVTGTGTLRIGSAIFPAGNYANFVAANTGTVEFTGKVQLPARDTYNNLILSGSTDKQLTNLDLTINGALNIAASTVVDNPTSQNINLTSTTSGFTVDGTFTLNDGKLNTGAFLATSATGTVQLGAGATTIGSYLTNGGTLIPGTAPISVATTFTNNGTYNSAAAASSGSLAVSGDFSNAGTYMAGTGDLDVTGNLANTSTGNFTANKGEVNAGGNFSNAGSYTATTNNIMHVNAGYTNSATGVFDAANSNMVLRGSFTNNNGLNFNAGTSLIQFITNLNQFINGNTTFYDLQKLGGNALTLGPSTTVHVADLLTIQNSVIFTGTNGNLNTLYLDNTTIQPIVGNTLTSYVAGRLAMALPNEANAIRVFPVGAGQRYRPVTIKPLGVSSSPVVLVEIINGSAPNANGAGNVDATLQNIATTRYYRIQLLSGTITQPTLQLSFNTDTEDEKVNVPGNLRVARSNGPNGVWTTAGGSGVYSPESPKGYTTSATMPNGSSIDNNSYFVLGSTNKVDNPLSGQAPLPVELITFSATRQGTAVQVAWATASEKNSDYFAVERSANGSTFAEIARVDAQGNSTARHDYGTLDRNPLGGISYYRLRQVDKDGTTSFSNVATVRFDSKAGTPSLLAYPNPATGTGFQLAASNLGSTSSTVRVFDNVGRVVFSQSIAAGTAEATVQTARPLASGMYFATWTTADGVKLTTKVSVE